MSLNLVSQFLSIFSRNNAFRYELLLILLGWSRNLSDLFVHDRLGEARLVHLVVTVVAIADHIKHHIFAVLAPVLNSKAARSDHSLWVRGVHTQNWYFKWLDEIRRVLEATIVRWLCREANLIVRDDMNRPIA